MLAVFPLYFLQSIIIIVAGLKLSFLKSNLKNKGKHSCFSRKPETIMRCIWPVAHLCTPFLASTFERTMSNRLVKLLGGGGYVGEGLLLCRGCDGSCNLAAQGSGRLYCWVSSWLSVPFASFQELHTPCWVHRMWGHFTVFYIPKEIRMLGQTMLSAVSGWIYQFKCRPLM